MDIMTAPPRCTVIVPTYNRAALLRHTLDSFVRQDLPVDDFEVIVADDGSSDGTDELVAGYADRLHIRYRYQQDEGFRAAQARNMGLRDARGPVSVFVDSGVVLSSRALTAHCAAHERTTGPAAVIGYVWAAPSTNTPPPGSVDPADPDGTIERLARDRSLPDIRDHYYDRYGERLWTLAAPWLVFWTCNVSVNTAQARAVGMFDEAYRSWGGEDVDLAYRLHRAGARFLLSRDAAAVHCPHPKEDTRSATANHRYFAAKYDTPITRLRPDHDNFLIEQVIRDRNLPSCAEYLAARGTG
ncbi:glycosyltransferase [Dactylosporangium siamense]|uniref:Glycosyl transferase n=1 Tax=Dactylosporangium siamense TaxID=685454 RepID=A0A919UDY9_9ACTN|nr:glycosyltransferase [Dactylosporangium siamense]GIG47128.1 glycosyl transferase [Dactylosporangium siamense]